jgi:hypothetical protein
MLFQHLLGKRVNSYLPRMRQRFFLYEYEIPESEYQNNIRTIEQSRFSPEIEGIYETQVPLTFR